MYCKRYRYKQFRNVVGSIEECGTEINKIGEEGYKRCVIV